MIPAGVHQAFSHGPHRAREDLNTHKVIGMASHMLVAAKFVVGPRPIDFEKERKAKEVVSSSRARSIMFIKLGGACVARRAA